MNTKPEELKVLVVKDEDGVLRPMAGIWIDNENGKYGSENYLTKNKDCTIAKATLTENQ